MRDKAQLDLTVIGIEQCAALRRDEELAHFAPERCAHGDILEIRFRRGDSAGTRFGLPVAGVDSVIRRNGLEQSLDIGRVQLCQLPVLQHKIDDRVLVAQSLEHFCIGRPACFCFLAGGQSQILKQHNTELLRRKDIEFFACLFIDALFERTDFLSKAAAELPDAVCIHAHTDMLHIGEHLDQRQLNLAEQLFHALLDDLLLEIIRKCGECRSIGKCAELRLIGERILRAEPLDQIFGCRGIEQIRADHIIQHEIVNRIMHLHLHPVDGLCVKGALRCIGGQETENLFRVSHA